jgi:hypothetical protein
MRTSFSVGLGREEKVNHDLFCVYVSPKKRITSFLKPTGGPNRCTDFFAADPSLRKPHDDGRYLVSLSKDATDCLPSRHLFPRQLQLPNSFSDPDAANLASLYIDEDDLLSTLPIRLPLLHQEAEAYFTGSKNARFLESFPKNVQYTKLQLSRMKGVGACFSGSKDARLVESFPKSFSEQETNAIQWQLALDPK